jgi:hypothetical protein
MRNPKLLILGSSGHGKDTVADMIRDETGWTHLSSSIYCAEKVVRPALEKLGVHYDSIEDCFNDRGNHRSVWFTEINKFCEVDQAALAREIIKIADIYVGMRDMRQLNAVMNENLFDYIIWVEDPRKDKEPNTSMNITYEDLCSFDKNSEYRKVIYIDNSKDLITLRLCVKQILRFISSKAK